ncbi:hypothetical protein Hanom_Chr06g00537331 [Helianthus anomalus]
MNKIEIAWLDVKRANRWDSEKEYYLDPQGNILTDPSTIDFAAFIKTTPTEEEEEELKEYFDRIRREKEEKGRRENPEKFVKEIIDVNQEMTAENLTKMAEQAMMTKALEVDTKTGSKSESSKQVSSVGHSDETGKNNDSKTENHCRNYMKSFKVCNAKELASKARIEELKEKINTLNDNMILRDKILKSSKEKIDLLEEKIKNDEKGVENFRKTNETLILEDKKNNRSV